MPGPCISYPCTLYVSSQLPIHFVCQVLHNSASKFIWQRQRHFWASFCSFSNHLYTFLFIHYHPSCPVAGLTSRRPARRLSIACIPCMYAGMHHMRPRHADVLQPMEASSGEQGQLRTAARKRVSLYLSLSPSTLNQGYYP